MTLVAEVGEEAEVYWGAGAGVLGEERVQQHG